MALPTSLAAAPRPKLDVEVKRPTPYTLDLGLLLANDPNPLDLDRSDVEGSLQRVARDGAQVLVNNLLLSCPIASTSAAVLVSLPPVSTPLPREKPVPAARPPTRWETFAARKGIQPKTREARRNLTYDEASGEWVRKWGYKGANKAGEDDWVVEVDMEKEAERKAGTSIRGDGRRERKEKVRRNERKMRKNQRAADTK